MSPDFMRGLVQGFRQGIHEGQGGLGPAPVETDEAQDEAHLRALVMWVALNPS